MLPCYACNNVPTIVTPHGHPTPHVCVRVENIVKQSHGRDIGRAAQRDFLALRKIRYYIVNVKANRKRTDRAHFALQIKMEK